MCFLFCRRRISIQKKLSVEQFEGCPIFSKRLDPGPLCMRGISVFSIPSAFKSAFLRGKQTSARSRGHVYPFTAQFASGGRSCIPPEGLESLEGGLEDHNGLFKAAVSYPGAFRPTGSAS